MIDVSTICAEVIFSLSHLALKIFSHQQQQSPHPGRSAFIKVCLSWVQTIFSFSRSRKNKTINYSSEVCWVPRRVTLNELWYNYGYSPHSRVETSVAAIQINMSHVKLNEQSILDSTAFLSWDKQHSEINSRQVNGLVLSCFYGGDLPFTSIKSFDSKFPCSLSLSSLLLCMIFFFFLFLPSTFSDK